MAVSQAVQNTFTKGLLTEYTGLNFPENAATSAINTEFTLIGNVNRRLGINYEFNKTFNSVMRGNQAITSYKWNNAGGDGLTQIVVEQIGGILYFYNSTNATTVLPLSSQLITSINFSSLLAIGGTFNPADECQYTDGNGYLFVYHNTCGPFYCTLVGNAVTANPINIGIRDFNGIPETTSVNFRPTSLSNEHLYNLQNQGWSQGNPWGASAPSIITSNVGNIAFTVASGIAGITAGQGVSIYNLVGFSPGGFPPIPAGSIIMSGNVFSYTGTTLTIAVTYCITSMIGNSAFQLNIIPTNVGYINTWFTDLTSYPSNADVWWYFKDSTNVFNPTTQVANVTLASSNAPQGHYILNAFLQDRVAVSSIGSLNQISTSIRPRTGTWFQGRVWYAGLDAVASATGDAPFYTWTENIYFSQIAQTPSDFGNCYQVNDPTSENLFDLLPSDGGVITIQGCGSIYRLFPIQNGMLVFAANGVWFITGSQGIGFAANDYTITKISSVRSISSHSFVNVNGLPFFWNEEGIYSVEPTQGGALAVNPLTVGTILTYYNNIPRDSIKYARGDYDPINYVIQWIFKSTEETSVFDRYTFDSILNFNTYNKAFFPYTVDASVNSINSIIYVASPGGTSAPDAALKYFASNTTLVSFAEEYDPALFDWGDIDYDSTFTTGYRLAGKSLLKFQPTYVYFYSDNTTPTSYYLQGVWDYAISGNSGRWSTKQQVNNFDPNYGIVIRKHKIRGRGMALQLQVSSVSGQPFDIIGWSNWEQVNQSI